MKQSCLAMLALIIMVCASSCSQSHDDNTYSSSTTLADTQSTTTASSETEQVVIDDALIVTTAQTTTDQSSIEDPDPAYTAEDICDYLNSHYTGVYTDLGDVYFTFTVDQNTSSALPYDSFIKIDYSGLSAYDLMYSLDYTDVQKQNAVDTLAAAQYLIYLDISTDFPCCKIMCAYYTSFYQYPLAEIGYEKIQFMTWCNYTNCESSILYEETVYDGDMHWAPIFDDYYYGDYTECVNRLINSVL